MLKNKILINLNQKAGIDYNNYEQLESAVRISKSASFIYKSESEENFSDFSKYLLNALNSARINTEEFFGIVVCAILNFLNSEEKIVENYSEFVDSLLSSLFYARDDLKENTNDFIKNSVISLFSAKDGVESSIKLTKYKIDEESLKMRIKEKTLEEFIEELSNDDLESFLGVLDEIFKINLSSIKHMSKKTINHDDVAYRDSKNIHLNSNDGIVSVSKSAYASARIKNGIKYGANLVGKYAINGISKIMKKKNKYKKEKSV